MADALAGLEGDPENLAAWAMFQKVVNRFTLDTSLVGIALERATREADPDDFADLLARFEILYDALCPPPDHAEK